MNQSILTPLTILLCINSINGWSLPSSSTSPSNQLVFKIKSIHEKEETTATATATAPATAPSNDVVQLELSRRQVLTKSMFITTAALLHPNPSYAATSTSKAAAAAASNPQTKTDKENLIKGYKRLNYLLNNWEKETTICGRSDNPYIGCERTPEIVMEYLGFKSMNDPLFRIDKTLLRLQPLVAGTDGEIDYMDAMEGINQAVEDGNGIAFVSSWGEANPGGGKDRIELFIERSKRYVIETRDGLGTIIKLLDMKVDG